MIDQNHIAELIEKRSKLLDLNYDDPEADKLTVEIIGYLTDRFDTLTVDFIIESFTKLGFSPSILYDDNGLWIIQDTGFQSIPVDEKGNEGIIENMSFIIEDKKGWKPTIREALKFWIDMALNTDYE